MNLFLSASEMYWKTTLLDNVIVKIPDLLYEFIEEHLMFHLHALYANFREVKNYSLNNLFEKVTK